MKSTTVISLLLAGVTVQAVAIPAVNVTLYEEMIKDTLEKRQILGALTSLIGKGGKVSDPPGAAPKKVETKSPSKVSGARRVKIRYGPYSVPNMNKAGINGEAGALWNYPDTSVSKPCTECTIVAQQAGLEYPDGKNANIDTGMWLHHMVHFTIGSGRWDPTCYGKSSLPHVDVGASPSNGERYFSSGNERTLVDMDRGGAETKAGYHLKSTDRYAFIVDLMNMNMDDKTVYMTMTYDIVDGPLPAGWKDIQVVWFDVNQCMTSEVNPPKQSGSFTLRSNPWTPNFEGEAMLVGGHIHDGGIDLQVKVAGGTACNSAAKYGEFPEYLSKKMNMGAAAGIAEQHISSMTSCYADGMKTRKLARSQQWTITAQYDYSKYAGNKDHNKQSSVMGIALMFVAIKPGTGRS